jgi:hypothetical protein
MFLAPLAINSVKPSYQIPGKKARGRATPEKGGTGKISSPQTVDRRGLHKVK